MVKKFVKKVLDEKLDFFYFDILKLVKDKRIQEELKGEIDFKPQCSITDFPTKKLEINQLDALEKFCASGNKIFRGFLFADEPGLGKTKEVILAIKNKVKHIEGNTVLYVCPKSLVAEMRRKLRSLNTIVTLKIINYEKLPKIMSKFDIVVFDEAHTLVNRTTLAYKESVRVAQNSKYVFLLTGTPIREEIQDMLTYLILMYIPQKNIDNITSIVESTYNLLSESLRNKLILEKIKIFSSRSTRENSFVPTGTIKFLPINIPVTDKELKLNNLSLLTVRSEYIKTFANYKKLKQQVFSQIKNDKSKQEIILKYLSGLYDESELRKLILDADLVQKVILLEKGSQKLKSHINQKIFKDLLVNTIKYIFKNFEDIIFNKISNYTKIIVFTKSRKVISFLQKEFQKHGYEVSILFVSDTSESRKRKIDKFRNSNNKEVLISTYQILQYGYDIPESDSILIIDFPYRPYVFEQAIHRVSRLNNISTSMILYLKPTASADILTHDFEIFSAFNNKISTISDELLQKG